jgi:hypothetical protein
MTCIAHVCTCINMHALYPCVGTYMLACVLTVQCMHLCTHAPACACSMFTYMHVCVFIVYCTCAQAHVRPTRPPFCLLHVPTLLTLIAQPAPAQPHPPYLLAGYGTNQCHSCPHTSVGHLYSVALGTHSGDNLEHRHCQFNAPYSDSTPHPSSSAARSVLSMPDGQAVASPSLTIFTLPWPQPHPWE